MPEDVTCPHCGGRGNTSADFSREFTRERGNLLQAVWQLWTVYECLDCREKFAILEKEEADE